MYEQVGNLSTNTRRVLANSATIQKIDSKQSLEFDDNRSETKQIMLLKKKINSRPQGNQLKALQLTAKQNNPTNAQYEENADNNKAGAPEIQNKKGKIIGSGTSGTNPIGWQEVQSKATKVKGFWVRFHCINQGIGGPGDNTNVVPTRVIHNLGTEWRRYEKRVDDQFKKNFWIWAKTSVAYHPSGLNYGDGFPSRIIGQAQYYSTRGDRWIPIKGQTLNISAPSFNSDQEFCLNEMTKEKWAMIVKLSSSNRLVNFLNNIRHEFTDIDDYVEYISDTYDDVISDLHWKYIDAAVKHTNPSGIKLSVKWT